MSRFFVLVLCGSLTMLPALRSDALPESGAQTAAGATSGDLQLVVDVDSTRVATGENPSFAITFRNNGEDNILLNGGALLGNGAQDWSAIDCEFRRADGQLLPLSMGWRIPGVAGRIYFLGVPLRTRSSYTISVAPGDYYLPKGEPLVAGVYGVTCTYTGAQSRHRDRPQLPLCWEGRITSNTGKLVVHGAAPLLR